MLQKSDEKAISSLYVLKCGNTLKLYTLKAFLSKN